MCAQLIARDVMSFDADGRDLYYGTKDGELVVCPGFSSWKKVFLLIDAKARPIVDLKCENSSVSIVLAGEVYSPKRGEYIDSTEGLLFHDSGDHRYGERYGLGFPISRLLSPWAALVCDNTLVAEYNEQGKLVNGYFIQMFEGTNVYDYHCGKLAINREMMSSTIYTIDLKDPGKDVKTFSYDGKYLSKLSSGNSWDGGMFDDFDEENLRQEELLHKMISPSLVLQPHHKRTYVDFVKITERRSDFNEELVISGGRDRRVVVSGFESHKQYYEFHTDDNPYCGCYNHKGVAYFGCLDGMCGAIMLDNINAPSLPKCVSMNFSDSCIKEISSNGRINYAAVLNDDNVVALLDIQNAKVLSIEEYDDPVFKIQHYGEGEIVVLTENGNLYIQQ